MNSLNKVIAEGALADVENKLGHYGFDVHADYTHTATEIECPFCCDHNLSQVNVPANVIQGRIVQSENNACLLDRLPHGYRVLICHATKVALYLPPR